MFKQPAVIHDKIKKASIVIVLYRNTKKGYKNHYFPLRNMNIYISMYQLQPRLRKCLVYISAG